MFFVPRAWCDSDDALIREVYPALREIAAHLMGRERQDHTLQRTALVHEALIRLLGRSPGDDPSPRSFLTLAAHQMRYTLIDYARRHRSQKAGGEYLHVSLFEEDAAAGCDYESLLALDQALERLGRLDPRALSVVELKFFGGFTNEETAGILRISHSTAEENWQFARSWLFGELTRNSHPRADRDRRR